MRKGWFWVGETRFADLVNEDRSYKPTVKSTGGKRLPDGAMVPLNRCEKRSGRKGLGLRSRRCEGKREGMTGPTISTGVRPLPPCRHSTQDELRLVCWIPFARLPIPTG
ncbi:hypothetical protein [Ferrimicrobium acidiphilum]|uniref:Uncharacterized protein n=1 Tax=Ferrimicrobium acidiphilum TaxID=121039 RepID=A0ABV3Y542_9ACTN